MSSHRASLGRLRSFLPTLFAPALLLFSGSAAHAGETQPISVGTQPISVGTQPDDLRLETVGYKLAIANADRCARPAMLTGMMLHDVAAYARRHRAAVAEKHDLSFGFGVRQLVSGSAAERAGVLRGDEIVAINGVDLRGFADDLIGERATYDRTERFVERLEGILSQGTAVLALRRGGLVTEITLSGDAACGGRLSLVPSSQLNAWADGKYVAITTKMLHFASKDDELAFVVGHEMSHNLLHHLDRDSEKSALFAELGIGARQVKDDEIEADGYAIGLMARAGFDLAGAQGFLRRSRKLRWMDLAITHPGVSRRVAIVNQAISRLGEGETAGRAIRLAAGSEITIGVPGFEARKAPWHRPIAAWTVMGAPASSEQAPPSTLRAGSRLRAAQSLGIFAGEARLADLPNLILARSPRWSGMALLPPAIALSSASIAAANRCEVALGDEAIAKMAMAWSNRSGSHRH